MLINSLLSHVNNTRWDEFIAELDRLNVRKAVIVCYTPLWFTIALCSLLVVSRSV
jgi:hypothetical protein